MKVAELKKALENVPDDMEVALGYWFKPVETAEIKSVNINWKAKTFFCIQEEED